MNDYSLFKGYESRSGKSYQAKRSEEKKISERNVKLMILKLEEQLAEPDLDIEEFTILQKRYKSLKERFKIKKTSKDLNELRIPFQEDNKTIRYIREKNCFKPKWIAKYGKERIERTIEAFKQQMFKKPENTLYWNPF